MSDVAEGLFTSHCCGFLVCTCVNGLVMRDTCQVTPVSSTGSRSSSSVRDNLYERFQASVRTPKSEKVDGWRKAGKLKAVEAPSFVGDVLEEIPGSIEGEGKSLVDLQGELRKKQRKEAAEKVVSKGVKTKALKDEREARKAERAAKKSLQEGTQNKAKRMKQYVPDRDDEFVEPEKDTHMHACKAHTHTLTLTLTKAHMHANTHIYMLTQCAHIHTRVTHTAHTHTAHTAHTAHTHATHTFSTCTSHSPTFTAVQTAHAG
jgi:hypothetical protein